MNRSSTIPNPAKTFRSRSLSAVFAVAIGLCGTISASYAEGISLAGHPDGAAGREVSLDGEWLFADAARHKAGTWDHLPVPGNWNTFTEYADYIGDAWYQTQVTIPPAWKNLRRYLKFDAVYDIADVWLNGTHLGQHTGGYTPFEFDITHLTTPGELATITVKANNSHAVGAWYQWGGISRSVRIFTRDDLRLIRQKIEPVLDLKTGTAKVKLLVTVANSGNQELSFSALGKIQELPGEEFKLNGSVPAGGSVTLESSVSIPKKQTRLWHFDDPQLYHLKTSLSGSNKQLDSLSNRFGIRHIEIKPDGLYLNGEKIRVMGYNRVHDHRAYGNTEPRHLVRADIDMMKRSGANFSRIMHAPCSPELLDYCDERGYLLWAEIPLWQTEYRMPMDTVEDAARAPNEFPGTTMREMMQRDWNHPSIIGWSPGNELRHEANGYVQAMRPFVTGIDSTRLYANIHDQGFSNTPEGGYLGVDRKSVDLMLINKYVDNAVKIKTALDQHAATPELPIFFSEYGGKRNEALDHTDDFTSMWERLGKEPYIIGGALWTFNDYRSIFKLTPPSQNRDWGAVDVWRNPKQLFHDISIIHQPVRSISISREGDSATVTIQPRAKLEVPSFTLRGYSWTHELLNANGRVIDGAVHPLDTVEPDSPAIPNKITWKTTEAVTLIVSLITNNGYTVAETRFDLANNQTIPPTIPPVADPDLRKVLPLDGGFMIGVTNLEGDTGLEVAFGTASGTYDQTLSAPVRGAIRVRNLENGKPYFGRVRRLLADAPGPWSTEFQVTPDGGIPPDAPVVLGFVRGTNNLAIRLRIHEKTTAYQVRLKSGNLVRIDCADPGLLIVPADSVALAVTGEHGTSTFTNLK